MRKSKILLVLALCTFAFVGCNKKEITNNEVNDITNIEQNTSDNIDENKPAVNEELIENIENKEEENSGIDENDEFVDGRIYYFEVFTQNNYYINTKLPKNDDEKISEIVRLLKTLPNNDYLESIEHQEFAPLRDDVKINKVVIEDDIVRIDFDKNISEGLGSSAETSVVESLIKTIGYNFDVNKVIITFNDENYTSGHIVKEDGEYFSVNDNSTVELKSIKE